MDEQFDFNAEIKPFLTNEQIKSADIQLLSEIEAKVILVTLDDITIEYEWSVAKAIQVKKITPEAEGERVFESLEGLLSTYSAAYRDKFTNDLASKLAALM
jgi:uncharacterized membrane protein YheB (UPF0754 family)